MNKKKNKIASILAIAAIVANTVSTSAEVLSTNKKEDYLHRKRNSNNYVEINTTNFPDYEFREYINAIADNDDDGFLSQEELNEVKSICLYSNQGNDVTGIEYFPNVETIEVSGLGLSELNLSNKRKLKYLDCSGNNLTSLNLEETPLLKSLNCLGNNLTSLDLNNIPLLEELNCGENNIKKIDITNCNSLKKLDSSHNKFDSINLSNNRDLVEISLIENNLRSLDLSKNTNLKILRYGVIDEQNSLDSINFGNISSLEELEIWKSNIKNVHLGNMPNLINLRFESSPIKELDVSGCKNLKKLSVAYSDIRYLDLRSQALLEELDIWKSSVSKIDLNKSANVSINGELSNNSNDGEVEKPNQKPDSNHSEKPNQNHTQIIGSNRYETAAKIADKVGSYDSVILVNADKTMADGLSAASLSGSKKAPILLVKYDNIPKVTMDRIREVKNIYIVGGENAISKNVEEQLKRNSKKINRISGKDRYETSAKIANLLGKYDKAFIVNGKKGEADAMSVSAVAAKYCAPILLTNGKNSIHNKKVDVKYYGVGGNAVIDNKLIKEYSAERIEGYDRYATNINIMDKFYGNVDKVYFAKGDTLIDALTASLLAKDNGIILVSKNKNHSELYGKNTIQVGGMDFNINLE